MKSPSVYELSEGGPGACKSAYPLIYGGKIAILPLFPLNQILNTMILWFELQKETLLSHLRQLPHLFTCVRHLC